MIPNAANTNTVRCGASTNRPSSSKPLMASADKMRTLSIRFHRELRGRFAEAAFTLGEER